MGLNNSFSVFFKRFYVTTLSRSMGLHKKAPDPFYPFYDPFYRLENDPFWLELVDLRNETVHTYKEEVAERVYGSLPRAVGYFETLLKKISQK